MARELPYIAAIGEAVHQEMERDETVLYFGQNLATSDEDPFLKAFGADIFFDDQHSHVESARKYVATGHVPFGIANER